MTICLLMVQNDYVDYVLHTTLISGWVSKLTSGDFGVISTL